MFFDNWSGLLRTLVVGVIAYGMLVLFLRISGKRTLSKLNAFDLVVTVALGSTLATMLLTKDVALGEGALGLALLIGLQYVVSWSSVRVRWVRHTVRSEPALLVRRGLMLADAMRRERITEGEVLAAVRSAGVRDVESVEAVVLETDGSLSVLPQSNGSGTPTSLRGVSGSDFDALQRHPHDA
jgi:uncharacterized membrane protein YcaP (DUF421 family)